MRLGIFLLKKSYRQHAGRLWLIATAITVGIAFALLLISGLNGIMKSPSHETWRSAVMNQASQQPRAEVAPLQMQNATSGNLSMWQNRQLLVTSLRATGVKSPALPGLKTPRAGEYYASWQLVETIRSEPLLAARLDGKMIGIIPDSLVGSPDTLMIIRGMSDQEAATADKNHTLSLIYSMPSQPVNPYNDFLMIMFMIAAFGLLFPIIRFISSATRLGSVQKERRYAALRLVGATRRQISRIAAVEILATAIIGIYLGFAIYFVAHPILAPLRFNGENFYISDMWITGLQSVAIIIITLIASLVANWWGMRSVKNTPLDALRKKKIKKAPGILRAVPLAIGLGLILFVQVSGKNNLQSHEISKPVYALFSVGLFLTAFGLLVAGPLLTKSATSFIAKMSDSPVGIIATKRIQLLSHQSFSSVSGVVFALFVGSFFITTMSAANSLNFQTLSPNRFSQLRTNTIMVLPSSMGFYDMRTLQHDIRDMKNVDHVEALQSVVGSQQPDEFALPCNIATEYTTIACTENSGVVSVDFNTPVSTKAADTNLGPSQIGTKIGALVIQYSGSDDRVLENLRNLVGDRGGTFTYNDSYVISGKYAQALVPDTSTKELASLSYIAIILTMLIASGSLIIATIAGLLERKRSFFTLRLSGMQVSQLKRVAFIESLIPLVSASIISSIFGIMAASVILNVSLNLGFVMPGWKYYVAVGGCLSLAALGIISLLPNIKRLTRLEENRTE